MTSSWRRRPVRLLAAWAALLVVALAGLGPWAAARRAGALTLAGERVVSFDVAVDVQPDGRARFVETIDYDFADLQRHGIYRDLVTRQRYDAKTASFGGDEPTNTSSYDTSRYDRVYPLEVVSVTSPDAPADVKVEDAGEGVQRLRIGDPDKLVTGRHTYRVEYVLKGVVNAQDGDDELYWNIVGRTWTVPIEQVTARVTVPGGTSKVACYVGTYGSTETCATAEVRDGAGTFANGRLTPSQGLSVVVSIPDTNGPGDEPKPILRERITLARGFQATPATVVGAVLVGGLSALVAGRLAWRTGRDRQGTGGATDVAFAGETSGAAGAAVPLFDKAGTPVEFVPPDGMRPGQLGVLKDETADTVDVSATIVDLAVRGYLRIEEIPDAKGRTDDYRLVRLPKSSGLLEYESMLLGNLFRSGPQVELSSLKNHFASDMGKVKNALYSDAMANGWFASRPDHVRLVWRGIGLALLGLGVLATVLLYRHKLALVSAPVVVVGLVLFLFAGRMPRRTPKGTGANRRLRGFQDFIDNSEKYRAQFAERANLFTEYLPYAMVFGATKKWARTFESLGLPEPDTSAWYVGTRPFAFGAFAGSVDSFSSTATSTLTSTPGGSGGSGFGGGGFSGGGGGGGGGGSW